jgi:beta-galactosidase
VYLGPYGGPLRPLIGCDVVDVAPLPPGETVELQWESGENGGGAFWVDVVTEREGRVLARVAHGALSGRPIVVETNHGKGRAYYVGSRLDPSSIAHLFSLVAALRGEATVARRGLGIERVVRVGSDGRYEFLINYSDEERELEVAAGGLELLTGVELGTRVSLKPSGIAIIRHPVT